MTATTSAGAIPTQGESDAPGKDAPGKKTAQSAWQRPAPSASQLQFDAVAAAGLFILAVLAMALQRVAELYPEPAGPLPSVLVLAALTIPLAWRRRYPSAVLGVVAVAFIVAGEAVVPEQLIGNVALFLAIYTVGAWDSDRRRALIVRLLVVGVMFLWLLITFFRVATDPPDGESVEFGLASLTPMAAFMLVQVLINILYFAGAIWFGNHAWRAAVQRDLLVRRAHELQAERTLVERQAVTIERMRLARELHDAVAHHVSYMGIQAAAARTLLPEDPQRAARELERVEDSAREAVEELHTLLGTLRSDSGPRGTGEESEAVGSLGVERITSLVEEAQRSGLRVTYQVVGAPAPLRPLASLNLYRIAQEALTNVRKHVGGDAVVDIRLRYLADGVELEVADDGAGRRRRPLGLGAGGLGLVGMRERVNATGGTLHVGPRRGGGFLVRAHLPFAPGRADDGEAS